MAPPPRPVTRNVYEPVGRCIYCGSKDSPLTDEHIIPEGMGGREILPMASCKRCEAITGRFEQMVMRHTMWPLRQALGMKGAKRKVPYRIPATGLNQAGDIFVVKMDHREIGLKGVLPIFHDVPGYMIGQAPTNEVGVDLHCFLDPTKLGSYHAPGGTIDIEPEWFARLLAKIAHAQAVAGIGIDNFEAFLPPVILGKEKRWPYLVGRASAQPMGPEPGKGHWVTIFRQRDPHDGLLLGRIRLFPELDGPVYDIVVGQLRDTS